MAHHTSIYRAGAWLSLMLLAAGCNGFKSGHTSQLHPHAERVLQ